MTPLTPLGTKPFENTVGKGEIALNEQFLLVPQCFLPICITFCHFRQIWNCRLQTLSVWKSVKFVVWKRVKWIGGAVVYGKTLDYQSWGQRFRYPGGAFLRHFMFPILKELNCFEAQGLYSSAVLKNILSLVIQIFLYLESSDSFEFIWM